MNSVFDNKNDCYGCASCVQLCPSGAIAFNEDKEGFSYPEIDQSKCTDCGLCRKACPIYKNVEAPAETYPGIYAVWNKDEELRRTSTSGGVFSALSRRIISQDGVVFGAAFSENIKAVHMGIDSQEQLWRLQGSKYTQSLIGNCYREIRELLRVGRKILFSGTPCQVSGLYSYLGKNHENLYTCDCVCHGVPSPGVFELYKAHLERLNNSKIESFNFRNKSKGWKNYNINVGFKNGSNILHDFREDPYMRGFISNMFLRPSCHGCKFASVVRQSDITLADFWGVDKFNPKLDDDQGTSLIMVNSLKGTELLEACQEELVIHEASLPAAVRENPSLTGPSKPHKLRSKFFSRMNSSDFAALQDSFLKPPSQVRLLWNRCLRIPNRLVRHLLRKA